MNKRIKELAEHAWEATAVSPDFGHPVSFAEKFAELIIQKCISQIALIGISNYENDDVMWATEKATENIREHFGMKDETN